MDSAATMSRPTSPRLKLVTISTTSTATTGTTTATQIAPDATVDDKGNSFYKVVVETDKNYLGSSESEFPILPGMVASVDIKTGTRSVAEFIVRPVLKLRSEGFRER